MTLIPTTSVNEMSWYEIMKELPYLSVGIDLQIEENTSQGYLQITVIY
jgi:hypothetical protein